MIGAIIINPDSHTAKMSKIFMPSSGPDDWKCLLADPEKHWAKGYSARTLAHAWEAVDSLPPEIQSVLSQNPDFEDITPLLIFPEWKVPLPGGSRPSQNDVWVLAKCKSGLVSITIEGKCEESFDKTLGEWLVDASKGKIERLKFLIEILGLDDPIPDNIYYQLLHRTASAIIEAERFGATHAVMLVHSFSPTNEWFDEYKNFAALFSVYAEIGKLSSVMVRDKVSLHLAWVHGDEQYLNS